MDPTKYDLPLSSFPLPCSSYSYHSIAKSATNVVPDLSGSSSSNMPMASLKSKLDGAKPLGLVRMEADQLLVVYDSTFS